MLAQPFHVPEKTKIDQRRAADPRASAWVSANAGAGKTKVLTDRVIRLLLAGTPPGRILCLTFTKAAAATMAIRVFERLGRWVALDEAELARELAELEGRPPSADQMRLARRLFARAVETPGGLKIDTIHAFCERILHLVPFEANVPARFAVLDESQSAELVAEATANVLAAAATEADPALADALHVVSVEAAGEALSAAIEGALRARPVLREPGGLDAALATLAARLGLAAGDSAAAIERAMVEDGLAPSLWLGIAEALRHSKARTDQACAEKFVAAAAATDPAERLKQYLAIFFRDGGEPRAASRLVTKSADPALKERLLAEQSRLLALDDRLKAAQALRRTEALFTLAAAIDARVEATKARLGALDFGDLIARTLALLSRGNASWVLYKLDRGIDHVLVDEAQDTNPEQWEILRLITADFTAGFGARAKRRTLFAVGDPKQSIYGFQGAAPQQFEVTRKLWMEKVGAAALAFEDVRLTLSFRSAKAVLSAVDATFAIGEHFRGLSFEDAAIGTVHESARPHAPGLVELWPVETPAESDEPDAWELPLDQAEPGSPPVLLARRIARAVRAWTTQGDDTGRVFRPGDVLVLVRKRGAAFDAVIRALKEAGVPVAGADRLDIGAHIAVLDLVAAGRAALLPEDDLTVATALKSPLVGLSDEDLERVAATRGEAESLVAALRRHAAAGDEAARRGCEALDAWRVLAREHGPFGFYATILGPLGARARLVARLGTEAGDAIDAFLGAAHGTERLETPSLTTFLAGFESASHTIKRDLEAGHDEVRVMTVHGAKGLEAPLVILVDGCDVLGHDPPLIPVTGAGGTVPVWSPGRAYDCAALAAAREAFRARALEEHNRLLYVAMTRAADRLVIAPFRTKRTESKEAWCEMVRRGLVATARGLERAEAPYGPAEFWREGAPQAGIAPARLVGAPQPRAIPSWLTTAAAAEPEPPAPLRPSSALAAADRVPVRGRAAALTEARLRGTLVHALLERLPGVPPVRRERAASAFVAARAPGLDASQRHRIVSDALGVLGDERLAPLFGPGSRAEAAIAGEVEVGGQVWPVAGQIDRLVVNEGAVLVADFKTSRPPGPGEPMPAAYLAQLALYRALLVELYPERPVRPFLVWTAGPVIREPTPAEMAAALGAVRAA